MAFDRSYKENMDNTKLSIGILDTFLEERHRAEIREAAGNYNMDIHFYTRASELEPEISKHHILYGYIPPALLKSATSLKWLHTASAGADRYSPDEVYADPEKVLLTNSNGSYGVTISEHIVMMLLMLFRRQSEYTDMVTQRKWEILSPIRSIYGSTIAVLGTGDIGTNFARRAKALGAKNIIGIRRIDAPGDPAFDRIVTYKELKNAAADVDALVMCAPSTAETAGILSKEIIDSLSPKTVVVNVGRGDAVDQDALIDALNSGRISGAALDVMTPEPLPENHPLYEAKNIILTPHISGNMTLGHTCDLNVGIFLRNLKRYAEGEPLHHVVDRSIGY